jgi:hypothetical protein
MYTRLKLPLMDSTKGYCEDEAIYTILIGGQAPFADLLVGRCTFMSISPNEHKIYAHTFKRSYDKKMNYTSTELIFISKEPSNEIHYFLDPENKLGHTLDGQYGRIRTSATRHSMYYDVLLMAKIHSDDQYFEMNNSFKMSMNLD